MKYRFGPFEADTASKELRKNGVRLRLAEQPFELLRALLERAGEEVPREDLQRRLWPNGTYVDFEKGLNTAVNKIREALADSASRPRYIETIPRRGYRFIARLEPEMEAAAGSGSATDVPSSPAASRIAIRRTALMVSAAAITVAVAAALVILRHDTARGSISSLLILPFRSVDAGDADYLGPGITEQVTARLTVLPGVRLISSAAAHRIGSTGLSPQEAGQRLGVEAVLFGSVRRTDRRIRVNAQMIRTADGQVLWAEGGLDIQAGDLLEAEHLAAAAIATRLRHSLSASQRDAITRKSTSNAEAYELLVRGRLALRSSRTDSRELVIAEKLLERATKLDPGFAEAFAWLAIAQYARFNRGMAGDEMRKTSLQTAWKAVAIDPTVSAARRALINIFHSTGQAEEGLKQGALLRQSEARDSDSLAARAQAYLRGGMPDRSIDLLEQALQLDPENDQLRGQLAFAAFWSGRYEFGLKILEASSPSFSFDKMLNAVGSGRQELARSSAFETMQRADAFIFAICWLNLKQLGDDRQADELWRRRASEFELGSAQLRNERVRIGLGIIYALTGDRHRAFEQVRLALDANPGDPWTLFYSASIFGLLGDEQKALESLRKAIDHGFLALPNLDLELRRPARSFYRFRQDPRFLALRSELALKVERLRAQY